MSIIRRLTLSLAEVLEARYGGEWNGRPLKLFNFFATGNQNGLRLGAGTVDQDNKITTRSVSLGRVFPIMDTDHLEANLQAIELAEDIAETVRQWGYCTPEVRDTRNFVTDWAKAPLSEVAWEPRPTDRPVSTTTSRPPIVTPAEVTPAFGAVVLVTFDLIY
jgi:hypothetical protein